MTYSPPNPSTLTQVPHRTYCYLPDVPTPTFTLSEEQETAVNTIVAWAENPSSPREFKLGGYAGTGKTTVIKTIQERLWRKFRISVCAFTGKAVSVLSRKQIYARTIHSTIYDTDIVPGKGYVFYLKSQLDPNLDLIIVDEASMVSTDLYNDLLKFRKKILWVGDPGQLEPVGDNPNLMRKPDLVLNKIHRQAEKSAILTLANDVRNGKPIPIRKELEDLVTRDKKLQVRDLLSVDQVICAKNKTRRGFNESIRRALNRPLEELVPTDKIIILRNSLSDNVFNGLILFIETVHSSEKDYWIVDAKDEVDKRYTKLKLWKKTFFVEKLDQGEFPPKGLVQADFGWSITCHKSQGSEWDNVLVYDEWVPPQLWDMRRWRYTAITRAAKKLIFCI